jgi:hypothetical protein
MIWGLTDVDGASHQFRTITNITQEEGRQQLRLPGHAGVRHRHCLAGPAEADGAPRPIVLADDDAALGQLALQGWRRLRDGGARLVEASDFAACVGVEANLIILPAIQEKTARRPAHHKLNSIICRSHAH